MSSNPHNCPSLGFQEQIPTCKDSDGVKGECVKVDQCKHVKNILISGKFDVSMRNYLIRTQCGFEEKTAKVCCTKDDPRERLSRKPATKKPKTDSSAPIDKPKWLKKLERVFPSPPICGTQKIDIEDKIFGGNRTKIDEYPWIVPLFFTKNHGKGVTNNCGGSLLSKRYVLSAAHCMLFPTKQKRQFVNVKLKFVRLGEWSLETPEDCGLSLSGNEVCAPPHLDIPALKNITHENYSADNISQYNDIALIEMSTDEAYTFEYSDFIKPICLPLNPDLWSASYENELFDVAGWGTTENGKMSQYKLKVTLPYFDREVFNERLKRLGEKARVLDKQFCAGGEKGKDSW